MYDFNIEAQNRPTLNPRYGQPGQTPFPGLHFRPAKSYTYLRRPNVNFSSRQVTSDEIKNFGALPERLQRKLIIMMLNTEREEFPFTGKEFKILKERDMIYSEDLSKISVLAATTARFIGLKQAHRAREVAKAEN